MGGFFQQKDYEFKAFFILEYSQIIIITEISHTATVKIRFFFWLIFHTYMSSYCDYGNYRIHFKFHINKLELPRISCLVFGVFCVNNACTGVYKRITIFYDLRRQILLSKFSRRYRAVNIIKFVYIT